MLDKTAIESWLRERDPARLAELWREADVTRREQVGDAVHLRGLLEISNHCVRRCGYCGVRSENRDLVRYRMSTDEILDGATTAAAFGYGTVVMQAGEDFGIDAEWLADVIREIKRRHDLAITLSLGERLDGEVALWRAAGADRYLLRFETSDRELFRRIHPDRGDLPSDRFALLRRLRDLGYETGSGVMVGIPGQTFASLARDIALFGELDLDMIGIGPWVPDPSTPLGRGEWSAPAPAGEQVPNDLETTLKAVAFARLVCPGANIPSTTALSIVDSAHGRELGLTRGANVVMPNVTPLHYRRLYRIYPGKETLVDSAEEIHAALMVLLRSIGRHPGSGHGGRERQFRI